MNNLADDIQQCPFAARPFEAPAAFRDPGVDYRSWREAGPIQRIELPGGLQAWVVTRYHEVAAFLRDDRFTRDLRASPPPAFDYGSRRYPEDYMATSSNNLFNTEGADHQRLLRLAMPFFTRESVRKMQPLIDEVVQKVVAPLAECERADLVADYAVPIPLQVVGGVLGVHEDLLPDFAGHMHVIGGWLDPASAQWQASSRALHRLALRAMNNPGKTPDGRDGLIGTLLDEHRRKQSISRREIAMMIIILMSAGFETTAALLAVGALTMVTDPAARRHMADLTAEGFEPVVAELLRLHPSSPWSQPRFALRDLSLAGAEIKAGDIVYGLLPAANRDPEVFTDPETLDLGRAEAEHLAFGQGRRRCIGLWLARAVAVTALSELARHLPAMQPAIPVEQFEWHGLLHLRALQSLPVERTA